MTETNDDVMPCAEKMVFDSQKQAQSTALAADWQHGASLKAYQCRHCHLWHLSSQPTD
jgi:hypothetical protein